MKRLHTFLLHVLLAIAAFCCMSTIAFGQDEKVWVPGWQDTTPLSVARAGGAIIEVNGIVYALGGVDGKNFLATTEYSRIAENGGLSPWEPTASLTEPRGFFATVAHGGFLYAVGGGNGPSGHNLLTSVERAKILPNGKLGPWQRQQNALNIPRRCVKVVVVRDRLYAFGGFGGALLDTVESAPILADGSVGKWAMENDKLTLPRYVHAVKKTDRAIIVLGGHNERQGIGLTEVEWSPIGSRGQHQGWRKTASLNTGRYGFNAAVHKNFAYALGGLGGIDYLRSIEKSRLSEETGEPLGWEISNPLSTPRANFGVAVYKEWIYIIGGTNAEGYYDTVEYASFNARGDVGFWGTKQQGQAYMEKEAQGRKAAVAVTLPHQGIILETLDATQYTYIRIGTPHGEEWIAAARGPFEKNATIRYSEGVMMTDFFSQTLERRFPRIRFVSRVEQIESLPHSQ